MERTCMVMQSIVFPFDKDFKITQVSKPFTYLHQGVEYCCGITIDHSRSNLIMAIGIEGSQTLLASVDLNTVRSLLEPVKQ